MATKKINPLKLRHTRIRKKVAGTPERPRLAVHFSGQHIYAQVIDDEAGKTLAAANTTEKEFTADKSSRANRATAEKVGKLVADRAKAGKVTKVVFDRGGFIYHGKVKALADAAREGGLEF
jgi:large subunit ribosomal protein L18